MFATLLLTLIPADVSLYTVRGQDLFRVHLTSGYTEQVAHWPNPLTNSVWDPDTQTLYGAYASFEAESTFSYAIDAATWTQTPASTNIAGFGIIGDEDGLSDAQVSAYDPATGTIWQYTNPLRTDLASAAYTKNYTVTIRNPRIGSGRTLVQQPVYTDTPPYPTLPPWVTKLVIDPIDGTLYAFQLPPFLIAFNTGDWTTKLVTRIDAQGLGIGPVAFYPGTHNLMAYTYDGSGYAWLSQVDLTTGELTQASPQFWAPAWQMFFRDE